MPDQRVAHFRLALRCHGILEIEDHRVRGQTPRLGECTGVIRRNAEHGAAQPHGMMIGGPCHAVRCARLSVFAQGETVERLPLATGASHPHMPDRKVTNMQSIRSVLFTAAAIALSLVALVFTASLALALAGIAAVIAIGSAIAARLNGRPRHARARQTSAGGEREMRIWNDGRGTIIDL
jgi:hypothetical protein